MYPDLSYLFHDLIGTAPDNWLAIFKTFGFFLALAFLGSGILFYIELKRKAEAGIYRPTQVTLTEGGGMRWGDILLNALAGAVLGGKGLYAAQDFEAFRRDPASIVLSSKMHWEGAALGVLLLGGISFWLAWRARTPQAVSKTLTVWPHDRISEMTVWAAVGGILGAKLFEAFDNWPRFVQDPIGFLASGSGLAFWGGLVLGFVAVVSYIRRHGIPFLPTADAVAPALTVGYGVGRIGCQLSGDGDWGVVNLAPKPGWMAALPDWMWATRYPHHVLNYSGTEPVPSVPIEGCTWDYCMQLADPVYPTPFYETMMMVGVLGILWTLRKRIKAPGLLFFIYLGLVAIERFLIEKIRVNVTHQVAGNTMTQAEIIAVILFVCSILGAVWAWQRHRQTAPSSN